MTADPTIPLQLWAWLGEFRARGHSGDQILRFLNGVPVKLETRIVEAIAVPKERPDLTVSQNGITVPDQ